MLSRIWTAIVWVAYFFMLVVWCALWFEQDTRLGLAWLAILLFKIISDASLELSRKTPENGIRH